MALAPVGKPPGQFMCPMVNYSTYMVLPWATLDNGVSIPVG
jgi:hypothetical protein